MFPQSGGLAIRAPKRDQRRFADDPCAAFDVLRCEEAETSVGRETNLHEGMLSYVVISKC